MITHTGKIDGYKEGHAGSSQMVVTVIIDADANA